MKVLVTGATGYLGSHLVKAFLTNGYQIIILKRSFSDTARIADLMPQLSAYDLDKCDIKQPFQDSHSHIDAIIHTATSYGRKKESDTEIFEANTAFPLHLLETAVAFNTGIFFNTDTSLPRDLNAYALSKKQFAEWGKMFAEQKKIRFVNIVLEHFYGPGDADSKFTTWIVQSCLKNIDKIELTPGEQKRDFIYIDDVVDAYLKLLGNCGSIEDKFQEFDLGSGDAVSIREFVEMVHSIIGSKTVLNFGALPYREYEIMESKADISKLREIGWKPRYDLIAGLKKMIEGEKVLGFEC